MKYYIKIDKDNKVKDCINYTLLNNEINLNGEGDIVEGFIETGEFPSNVTNGNYIYENGVFIENPLKNKIYTKYAFRQLFTFEERVKMDNYEQTIDAIQGIDNVEKQKRKAIMKTIMEDFKSAEVINMSDANFIPLMQAFVSCGIITEERLKEILSL